MPSHGGMNRRFFLKGLGYLSLASLATSCRSSSGNQLSVHILRRSLPIQLLRNAKRSLSPTVPVSISARTSVAELYGQLQRWEVSADSRDEQPPEMSQRLKLVGLGDYWLTQAIQSGLIEPLSLPAQTLDPLSAQWQSLVRRNEQGRPDRDGKIWGAPYRWGATVLVYRKDKLKRLGFELRDWSDLWRPELTQRIGLLNQPREVIGMTLNTLGSSYNTPNLKEQKALSEKLRSLHQQTRVYSSTNYIQPLMLGDTWVAMGWSSDVFPALPQDQNLGVIFPESGSALWADVWVKAKDSAAGSQDFPVDQLTLQWIQHWWKEDVAPDIAKFTHAAPVIPAAVQSNSPSQTILTVENLKRSEFLLPLASETIEQYRSLWLEMRTT